MRQSFIRYACATLILLLPSLAPAVDPNQFSAWTYTEPGTGLQLPYRVYRSPYNSPPTPVPLIVFLHGADCVGTDNLKQVQANYISNLLAHVKSDEYCSILMAPQANSSWASFSDNPTAAIRMTLSAIKEVESNFNIDINRIYLTGASMGGYGTWDVAWRDDMPFAAYVPICGGGDPSKADLMVDQPIWAFHAVDDEYVSVQYDRDMIAARKAAGGNPLYTEYGGGGHVGSINKAYNETAMYDWMFSQSLPEPGSLSLAIIGIVGVGCYRGWRRFRKKSATSLS